VTGRADSLAGAGAKLIRAGVIGAVSAGVIATTILWLVLNRGSGLMAAGGAVAAAVALALGQGIVTASARSASPVTLVAALLGYIVAIALVGITLVALDRTWDGAVRAAAIGAAAASAGYLVGAIAMYPRLRLLVFGDQNPGPRH